MTEQGGEESYGELARRLMQDGEDFAKTRASYYRELASYRAAQARGPAIMFFVALVLVGAAIIAIAVGCVIALVPLVGGLLAGLIVGAAAIATAGLLAVIGKNKLAALKEDPFEGSDLHLPVDMSDPAEANAS